MTKAPTPTEKSKKGTWQHKKRDQKFLSYKMNTRCVCEAHIPRMAKKSNKYFKGKGQGSMITASDPVFSWQAFYTIKTLTNSTIHICIIKFMLLE